MKMKVFLILFLLQGIYNENVFCQEVDSNGVRVMSLGFDELTWAAISCEKFATLEHHPNMKFRKITNKDSLFMLDSFLGKVKFKKKNRELDVRAQIKYEMNNKTIVTICLDSIDAMINGKLIKRNDPFVAFLFSMMP